MDFGIFLPTTNNGYILSKATPSFLPSVDMNRDVAAVAEQTGYRFLLAMSKFRGYGADGTGFWDYSLDPMGLIGALIGDTETLELWGSVAGPTLHPAMAARLAATYDDASGGRFVLNVVAGWNEAEYAQMGLWPENYLQTRYASNREYIAIIRELWATGRSSRVSDFYSLADCLVQPTPRNGVRIVVPGQSAKSLAIAADYADFNFVQGDLATVTKARNELVEACALTGRTVDSASLYGVITAETDDEAIAQFTEICRNVDFDNAEGLVKAGLTDNVGSAGKRFVGLTEDIPRVEFDDDLAQVVYHPSLFHPHLVGSYERVAAFFRTLEADTGVARAVVSFPDFTTDVETFGRRVIPLVNGGSR